MNKRLYAILGLLVIVIGLIAFKLNFQSDKEDSTASTSWQNGREVERSPRRLKHERLNLDGEQDNEPQASDRKPIIGAAAGNSGNEQSAPTSVSGLNKILKSSADDDTKEMAAESLAKTGTEPAARALIEAIKSAKGLYRDNLIQELRNISNPAACVPLVEMLRNLEDMPLHRECRLILLKMDSAVPAQTLVAAFEEVNSQQQREALAFTISMLNGQEVVSVLEEAGRSSDELLATSSFMGLARIGGTNALAALMDLSKEPRNLTGERALELRTAILRAKATKSKNQ